MIIPIKSGDIEIEIPKVIRGNTIKNVGIKVSGGADSAILLYSLVQYNKLSNNYWNLIPMSYINDKKPYTEIWAPRVVSKVSELTGYKFTSHIISSVNGDNFIEEQQTKHDSFFTDGIIDVSFYGETMNPPPEVGETNNNCRAIERDVQASTRRSTYSFRPFRNINKKDIADIYTYFDVHQLFEHTRSCELVTTDRIQLLEHCGNCWWCHERKWAFGKL